MDYLPEKASMPLLPLCRAILLSQPKNDSVQALVIQHNKFWSISMTLPPSYESLAVKRLYSVSVHTMFLSVSAIDNLFGGMILLYTKCLFMAPTMNQMPINWVLLSLVKNHYPTAPICGIKKAINCELNKLKNR